MDPRKCIFLVAGLLFLEISSPVDACRCVPPVLQNSYCGTDVVVLQVTFLEASQNTDGAKGYKVRINKVLKGGQELESVTFINSMSGSSCEYYHDPNEFNVEYLIIAYYDNGVLRMSSCSYKARFSELSPGQNQGLEGAYDEGCTCNVVTCFYQPCSSGEKTCILEQYEGGNAEYQIKKQVCVPKTGTECIWKNIE
ncbi:metalloproteinase inhibitor 1-like [Lissotriton helveticus]